MESNSFGGTPLVLEEYGLAGEAFELNRAAARIAREASARFDEAGRIRFVCGSMGPTTRSLSVTGGILFEEMAEHYRVQALGLLCGGADYLLLETCHDTSNIKAGLTGIDSAFAEAGWSVPIAVSATFEENGMMLAGQDADAFAVSLLHRDLLYIGTNCGAGPEMMTDHVRALARMSRARVACVPNAGMPDENGTYNQSPASMAEALGRFLEAGRLNVIGGCCGTGPEHVRALAELAREYPARKIEHHNRALVSGIEAVELTDENRPLIVGERTNVLGSRRFRKRIEAGEFAEAAEIGRTQVRSGAQIVDVCLQNPGREEEADMVALLTELNRAMRAPVMIDSTDADVMEKALTLCQGKCVLNSINMENGRERFDRVVPLAKRFGAALVVGLIDTDGMAVTVERKLTVAKKSYRLLTGEFGVRPEDIWWDTLVFPCATGDEGYLGAAAATVEAIGVLKNEFPGTRTILGISNVSFGLPPAGREVLNAVFLHHAYLTGLDAAIVNAGRLARYAEISEEERKLAEELLFIRQGERDRSEKILKQFTNRFRERKPAPAPSGEKPGVEERLRRAVIEGSRADLTDDIREALDDKTLGSPLAIINGPLMSGMAEVGRLFDARSLIVAEVLRSAEVMKAAVSILEPLLDRSGSAGRGKVLLATVKGDVHDIGKNLVEILLSNNGFDVIDLGVRVPSDRIIRAIEEHRPTLIGLSGLLVRSAHQMAAVAGDLAALGIDTPLLVGGAALSRRFVEREIAPHYKGPCAYASDAMSGLRLAQSARDTISDWDIKQEETGATSTKEHTETTGVPPAAPAADLTPPSPPDTDRHEVTFDREEIARLINERMLYGKHLGFHGGIRNLSTEDASRLEDLRAVVREVGERMPEPRGVWRFLSVSRDGDRVFPIDPERGDPAGSWEMPRQKTPGGLSVSDFILPDDFLALFVVTAGAGVAENVAELKEAGEYLKCHALASLALVTAEATAEYLHARIRAAWGFPDPAGTTARELFTGRYRGKRYSFGYSAVPELEGQRLLFRLLHPEGIGVHLTDECMMDPEASVSAIVLHHPEARHFKV